MGVEMEGWFGLLGLNASVTARVISRWWNDDDEMSISVVEETRVPGGNHWPTASNWQNFHTHGPFLVPVPNCSKKDGVKALNGKHTYCGPSNVWTASTFVLKVVRSESDTSLPRQYVRPPRTDSPSKFPAWSTFMVIESFNSDSYITHCKRK